MNSLASSAASQNSNSARAHRAALLTHLQQSQNADGGWPFHPQGYSRVEPTCWALRALADPSESGSEQPGTLTCGIAFLKSHQLSDGSWPATPWSTETTMPSGAWVTSLAASVLAPFIAQDPSSEKSVHAALQWLCDDYPRDSSRWQKFLNNFSSNKHASHNDEFRGWGWTPRTSSWVEPTAFALMAFASVSEGFSLGAPGSLSKPGSFRLSPQLLKQISDRRALAIGLLYDRMCAGGGWNCGNPRVYGVDGDSLVLPTCWALLALRDAPDHPNRALSLVWLQKSYAAIASPGSLALAQITLETYAPGNTGTLACAAVATPPRSRTLVDWSAADLTGQGTHVAAWVSLALNPARSWFTPRPLQAAEGPAGHQSPQ
jgi:hypothetical protein